MAFQELAGQIRTLQLRLADYLAQLRRVSPAGMISAYAGSSAPEGWLLCDGRAVNRADHPALFLAIGTTYGTGNGSSTFSLPNLAGRVPAGRDAAQTEFATLGQTGGAKTHTLTAAQMPSHLHDFAGGNSFSWGPGGDVHAPINAVAGGGSLNYLHTNQHGFNKTKTTGSGQAHNNLQPYLTLHFIIKT